MYDTAGLEGRERVGSRTDRFESAPGFFGGGGRQCLQAETAEGPEGIRVGGVGPGSLSARS